MIIKAGFFTSYNNTVPLPGLSRADGAAYYAVPDGKTRLAFNIENLFDRKRLSTVDGDNSISPGVPRAARLTQSTKF